MPNLLDKFDIKEAQDAILNKAFDEYCNRHDFSELLAGQAEALQIFAFEKGLGGLFGHDETVDGEFFLYEMCEAQKKSLGEVSE